MPSDNRLITNNPLDLAAHIYAPRILGYLGGLAIVYSVLAHADTKQVENPWLLSALFIVSIAWPHVARELTFRSSAPAKTIIQTLLFDSFFCAIWLPIMSFELIPSLAITSALAMSNISAGGLRLFIKGLGTMLIGIAVTSVLVQPDIQLHSNTAVIFSCIPLLFVYPILLGSINYTLSNLLLKQKAKLITISQHDSLTGLYNRRYWEQRLVEEFNRCQRSGEKACVMMVDIDYFKNINDSYGHLIGDNVLKQFGTLLQQLRASDIAGRYGGEEFAVLLPNSNLEESLLVAERLRQDIENTQFDSIDKCTVSIGIASLDKKNNDAYKWLDHADKALYQAKKDGRNKVNIWLNTEGRSSSRATV